MLRLFSRFPRLFLWLVFIANPASAAAAEEGGLKANVTKNFRDVAKFAGLRKDETTDKLGPLELFGLYLELSIGFIGVLFIVQVVHGGLLWMTAGGNEEQVTKARKKVSNSVIGAAIMFAAYIFTYFVLQEITGAIGIQFKR